jgi:hypothetical protein
MALYMSFVIDKSNFLVMAVFTLAICVSETVSAQNARDDVWLVTAIDTKTKPTTDATNAAIAELRQMVPEVIDPHRAAALFEQMHSREALVLEATEVEKLQKALTSVIQHLAFENLAEALEALKELERLTPDVADYLNRKKARAERIFQACLLTAHLLRKEGDRDRAYKKVAECVRAFPGFKPDENRYPDDIVALYQRAVAEISADEPSTVHIQTPTDQKCRARINGIDWGSIPTSVPDVRCEQVRVQVDCGKKQGRIYRKELKPGDNEVVIDARFDQVVQTGSGLWLKYATAADSDAHRLQDNVTVARVIGARHVLQIDMSTMRLYRIDIETEQYVAFERLNLSTLRDAIARLIDAKVPSPGQMLDVKKLADADIDQKSRTEPEFEESDSEQRKIWGYAGAALSVGALATGWVYLFVRRNEWEEQLELDPNTKYDGYRAPILAFTSIGSVGLTASLALVLPEQKGVPWWSYLFGIAGAGLATYGIYYWALDDKECSKHGPAGCSRGARHDNLGGLFLAIQSIPLLSIPTTYLIRRFVRAKSADVDALLLLKQEGHSLLVAGSITRKF